jgi:hypothetical protein
VRVPRVRIAWLMIVVALAALDFGAIRAMSDSWGRTSGLLGLGLLPMANVLAFAPLVGLRRRAGRGFLLGFEMFGATAMALYAGVILSRNDLVWTYFVPAIEALQATIGPIVTTPRMLIYLSSLGLWATWPQVAFALVGGLIHSLTASGREVRGRPSF